MGLTPQEERIMAHWDNGLSVQAIARTTGINLSRVRIIVAWFHEGQEATTTRTAMIAASHQLATAIQHARMIG